MKIIIENDSARLVETISGYELQAVQTVNYDGIIAKEMVPVRTYMYSGYVREERTGNTYRLYGNPLEQAKKDIANGDY